MKTFKSTMIVLILVYLVLYIANISGYYEYSIYNKTSLTNEQIQKFEQDVKEGNKIDLNDYIIKSNDYSNKLSQTSLSIGKYINNIFKTTFTKTLEFLNKMVE